MRDIPVFTTENGAASLTLREIPFQAAAYITIHDSLAPQKLLDECVAFCRSCGAQRIYARGHEVTETYPVSVSVLRLSRPLHGLLETDAQVQSVGPDDFEYWRSLYNERMRTVSNAAHISAFEKKKYLDRGGCYFVRRDGQLLGIGMTDGVYILAVAAVQSGAGRDVLLALCRCLSGAEVTLEVASDNVPALRLYKRLGFRQTATVTRWHRIV